MSAAVSTLATMEEVRAAIDLLDAELVGLLAKRVALIENAARIKAVAGLPANIPARVEDVVAKVRKHAAAQGVSPELVETLWRELIGWSIALEEQRLARAG